MTASRYPERNKARPGRRRRFVDTVRKGVETVARTGRRYLFAGGGTGGHVTPNLALIGELRARDRSAAVLYLGSGGGYEQRKLAGTDIPFRVVRCAQFVSPRRPLRFLRMAWNIVAGVVASAWHIARFKPDVVVATGGYASVPPVLAAALLKKPVFLHEQNARPGAANRFLARFADRIGTTFARTLEDFPPPRGVHLGYPVRQRMAEGSAEDARRRYGVAPGRKVVFVLGGSMGARSVNRGIVDALPTLLRDPNVAVVHATGLMKTPEYHAYEDTIERLQQLSLPTSIPGRYVCREFFDDIADVYALADLVIARSGAGVVMELAAVGKPSILVPKSDAPGAHQLENAVVLEEAGAAEIFFEEPSYEHGHPVVRVFGDALARRVSALLSDEEQLLRMGRAAHRLAVPDAAKRCVDAVDEAIEGAPPVVFRKTKSRVAALLDSDGVTHELRFGANLLASGALSDVRLKKARGDRATIQRRRSGDVVEFHLLRRSGAVSVNGEGVSTRRKLSPDDVLEVGGDRFTFRVFERDLLVEDAPARMARKAGATFAGTLASRLFGFLREAAAGRVLGLGGASDVMTVGLRVSNFFRSVFAETAVDAAFQPTYVELYRSNRVAESNRLFGTTLKLLVFGTTLVATLAIVTTPKWIGFVYAPKGPDAAALLHDAIKVVRIMFVYLILVSIAALLSAALRAYNRFGLPAGASIAYTVGVVVGLALYPKLGIEALGYGVVLGGIGQVAVQLPPFFSKEFREARGFRVPAGLDLKSAGLRRVGRAAPNTTADAGISQAGTVVDLWLAKSLMEGSVSALYWGRALFLLPFALVSQTINTIVLKEFSEGVAVRDHDWTRKVLAAGVNWNVFFLAPICVLLVLLARPITDVVYLGGAFDPEAARRVALALQCYALGLPAFGIVSLTGRFFAARGEMGTGTLVNLGSLLVNVALAWALLSTSIGFAGIALATSASYTLAAIVRLAVLNARLRDEESHLRWEDVWPSFAKTTGATAAGAAAAALCLAAIGDCAAFETVAPKVHHVFRAMTPLVFGLAAYGGAAFLLQSQELDEVLARVRRGSKDEPERDRRARPVAPQWLAPPNLLAWVEKHPNKAAKVDLEKRVATLLEERRWQDRNVGVKLAGRLRIRSFRRRLCALATDRRKASVVERLLGGDFREPGFVRRNALAALAKMPEPDELIEETLLTALGDPYFEARAAAASTAGALAPAFSPPSRRRLAASVLERVGDPNFEVAMCATQALGRLADDDGVVERLRELHYHPNWRLRDAVVEAYLELFKRGVMSDRDRLSTLLDDVLATCDDFKPKFPLRERLLEARRLCRPSAKDGLVEA
jgi:murein biosynthesis integral membrane protein MurJ/undecaprenyldiphospho-muramoylpentapeptide beta-N-acetylglucosaminyltransferase